MQSFVAGSSGLAPHWEVPTTTFHLLPDDGTDAAFSFEEVVDGSGVALPATVPLPLVSLGGAPIDFQFASFDDGALSTHSALATISPASIHHFAAPAQMVGQLPHFQSSHSPAYSTSDDSDASSTPSTPSTPGDAYEIDAALPSLHSVLQLPPILIKQEPLLPTPSTGTSAVGTTAAVGRSTKRRRSANNSSGDSDDKSASRVSWIPANEAKVDEEDDDDDDCEGDEDGKKGKGRKGAGGPAAKQSKRERNKISASKYRKRRKQYLDGLEGKVNELQATVTSQTKKIASLNADNKVLREQIDFLKRLLPAKLVSPTGAPSVDSVDVTGSHAPISKGVGSATGVLLFAFFACFMLFTPPWQPNVGGGNGLMTLPLAHPSAVVDIAPMPQGRISRALLQIECPKVSRFYSDDEGCCLCKSRDDELPSSLASMPPRSIAATSAPASSASVRIEVAAVPTTSTTTTTNTPMIQSNTAAPVNATGEPFVANTDDTTTAATAAAA